MLVFKTSWEGTVRHGLHRLRWEHYIEICYSEMYFQGLKGRADSSATACSVSFAEQSYKETSSSMLEWSM
jgi:hypothetical protein